MNCHCRQGKTAQTLSRTVTAQRANSRQITPLVWKREMAWHTNSIVGRPLLESCSRVNNVHAKCSKLEPPTTQSSKMLPSIHYLMKPPWRGMHTSKQKLGLNLAISAQKKLFTAHGHDFAAIWRSLATSATLFASDHVGTPTCDFYEAEQLDVKPVATCNVCLEDMSAT